MDGDTVALQNPIDGLPSCQTCHGIESRFFLLLTIRNLIFGWALNRSSALSWRLGVNTLLRWLAKAEMSSELFSDQVPIREVRGCGV